MKPGPELPGPNRKRYIPPRPKRPRITIDDALPDGVRRRANSFGTVHHEFLQEDGRWLPCGSRRNCRECRREDAIKTTMWRMRDMLDAEFAVGDLPIDAEIFGDHQPPEIAHAFGDKSDRVELLLCMESEFDMELPDEIVSGTITLRNLVDAVDELIGEKK